MRSRLTHPWRRPFCAFAYPASILVLLCLTAACAEETGTPEAATTDTLITDPTAPGPTTDPRMGAGAGNSVVEVLRSDSRFSTLAAALDSAGLATTLEGPGPFTVFAPTNAAFDALPQGTTADLMTAENRQQLRDLLMHHVVDGRLTAQDLQGRSTVTTLEGSDLNVDTGGGQPTVDGATISQSGIEAGNGIVHVIDTVLMPDSEANL